MKLFKQFFTIALIAVVLATAPYVWAADSLSYSGRLVNTNGSPVVGPVDLKFELAYSGNTAVILCSQDINSVALTNGVFHAKLELVCGSSLNEVLANVPAGQEAVIRVTNVSATPDKVYSFQALHAVPSAQVAHSLSKLNANNNEVLTWTGSKWEPKPASASGGTVTSVATGTGLLGGIITNSGTLSVDVGTGAGKIPQLDGSGKLATSVETDPTVQSFAKNALPTCGAGQVLKSNGTVFSCVADVDTDTTLVADGSTLFTTGLTIGVKAQGLLDTHLSGISSSCGVNQILMTNGLGSFACANKQWGESLGNLFFNTGAVTIGGTTPASSAILDLQSTTKGFLPPRMTTAQRNGLAATVGLMVYDTTENALFIFDGTQWIFASDSKGGYFRATRLTNQSAANGGTSTTILPNVESIDTENAFDPATGMYTVPRSGFYHFSAIVYWDSINTYGGLTIKANTGAIIGSVFHQLSTGSQLYLNASGSSYLNAGDKVYAYVWQWNAGAANVTYSSLAGFRVGSGGASGGGGGGALTADSVSSGHVVDDSLTVDDLNFASSEGINFPQLPSDPGAGVAGQIYYNSTSKNLVLFNGTSWLPLGSGSVSANSVDSSKIVDGSITYADLNLADGDVPLAKLAGTSDSSLYLRGDKTWANFLTQVLATTFTVTPSNSAISNGDSLQTVVNKTQGQINNLVTTTGNHLIKNGTDTISGTVTVSAATGFLKIPMTPSGVDLTDAANVQYVNNYVDSYGQWTKSGGNVYRSTGNVGIGTNNPLSPLQVNGVVHSSSGGFKFPDGTIQTTAAGVGGSAAQFDSGWTTMASGNFYVFNHGLGASPQLVRVIAKDDATGKIIEVSPQYAYGYSTYGGLNSVTSDSSTIKIHTGSINRLGAFLTDANTGGSMEFATSKVRVLAWSADPATSIWSQSGLNTYFNSGNVGIGTITPTATLEVAGQVKITGGTPGAGKVLTSDASGLASWGNLNTYTAGTGLTLTGSTFSVNLSASEIPNLDAAKVTTGIFPAARLPATTSFLGSTIESAEITDGTIAAADIGTGAVGSAQVADNSLTATDLAANSVGSSEIAASAVSSTKTGSMMVTCNSFAGGSCIKFSGIDIATCPAGTYPVSGGGICPVAYFLRLSNFTSSTVDDSAGWGVRCENSAGTYAEADEVTVLCMKY